MKINDADGILVFASSYNRKTGALDRDVVSRLRKALSIWYGYRVLGFIVTGGVPHPKKEQTVIAQDMALFLQRHGVPMGKINTEGESLSTLQNIVNSLKIIKKSEWKTVVLVSNALHLLRIRFYIWRLRKKGLIDQIDFIYQPSCHLNWWNFLWESLAWAKILLKGARVDQQ
ncbi:YdcF family protein [bacterium]|nr:MAG: YdcF family protein [bacterium]